MGISVNKKFAGFVKPMRYKVAYGGRGSAKSWSIARILLYTAQRISIRVLCTREIQDSIKDSVHKLLRDQIDILGLQGFTVQNDVIRHSNGSEFLFKGLYTNLSKIKSFEGVDICWIEEAESISAMSWEILDPTIRKSNSEIWISFNPRYEDDIIYKTFILNKPDNALVIKANWNDNKYFPDELKKQKDQMAKTNPDLYLHIWEGEIKKNTQEQIFRHKWSVEEFKHKEDTHFYYGADWGFSQDPNTVNRCFIDSHETWGDNCLYIDYEANDRPYEDSRAETSTDLEKLPEFWRNIPEIEDYIVEADSARPETISFMRGKGFKVKGVKKWAGSVEDGIEFLRSFDKIIIHPRCFNTIWEFKNYKYKVDAKSGQITNNILDRYNHHIDAIRYAINDVLQSKKLPSKMSFKLGI